MIICTSDRHRKPGELHKPYLKFLDYVSETHPELWMQLGDIDDLAWFRFHTIYSDPFSREEIEREREIAKHVTTVRLAGNHDWDIYSYRRFLIPILIMPPEFEMDGIKYSHWHEYDPITNHIWTPLTKNQCVSKHLPKLYTKLYGTPGYVSLVDTKKYNWMVKAYHEHFLRLTEDDGISRVGGHTHYPHVQQALNGKWVGNCGSASVMSWLEITDWGWRKRHIDELDMS